MTSLVTGNTLPIVPSAALSCGQLATCPLTQRQCFGPAEAGGDLAANQSAGDVQWAAGCGPSVKPNVRAVSPVLASNGRAARLAHADAGNLSAMVRSGYCVPSSGPPLRRLVAPRLDVTVPATTQNATALRRTFSCWVHSLIANDAAEDLTVAVYEALTNAAEHAFTAHRTPGSIWLHAILADGQITVTVADNGSWRHPTDSGGYRGRGLPLIHQLTTEAHIAPSPYGTTVRLRRQCRAGHYGESASSGDYE